MNLAIGSQWQTTRRWLTGRWLNRFWLLCAALMLLLAAVAARAQPHAAAPESAVKAAYLLNFAHFVEWPAEAMESQDSFVIGVYGDDALATDLEQLAAGRRVRGLPVSVRRARDVREGERVHLAYIDGRREYRVGDKAARLDGPVLVVTHLEAGLSAGAALNFVLDKGKLRFEASPRNAEQRGLRLSSRLLAVALAVEGHQS